MQVMPIERVRKPAPRLEPIRLERERGKELLGEARLLPGAERMGAEEFEKMRLEEPLIKRTIEAGDLRILLRGEMEDAVVNAFKGMTTRQEITEKFGAADKISGLIKKEEAHLARFNGFAAFGKKHAILDAAAVRHLVELGKIRDAFLREAG